MTETKLQTLPPGTLIGGKYEVLKKIGQGGMSVVYLVMDTHLNKNWALKEVRRDVVQNFEVVKQGLIVETNMLKKLSHPNLPRIVDIIDQEGVFYVIMDYIEGRTLSAVLKEYGAQPQENVVEWAKQLCDVLSYLHSRTPPIIYRDMKPGNIMLKPEGGITLIDFGIAREFKKKNSADTTCLGTLGYAAPEQFGGHGQTDARTDIYCLGATLYHLVTGKNPCEPPYEILPIRQVNAALSPGLERILIKCTQRDPKDRYQNCAELMYALEHYDEIDDSYRKKQRKKMVVFCIPSFLCCASILFSVFSWNGLQTERRTNYDWQLGNATNLATESVYQDKYNPEVMNGYLAAIHIDASREEGYTGLLDYSTRINQTQSGLDTVCALVDANKEGIQKDSALLVKIAKLYFQGNSKDKNFSVNYMKAAKYFAMADVGKYPDVPYLAEISKALGSFSSDINWKKVSATLDEFERYNDKQTLTVNRIRNYQLASGAYTENKREFSSAGVDPYQKAVKLLAKAQRDADNLKNDVSSGSKVEDSSALPQITQEIYSNLATDYYTAYTVNSRVTNYDKALEYLELLLTSQDNANEIKTTEFRIADVYVQKNDKKNAETQYEKLIRKYPSMARPYLDYAVFEYDHGNLPVSLRLYRQASKQRDAKDNPSFSKLGVKLKNAGLL